MASIFTRIINREIPGYIIHENEKFIAFLDINPLVVGHTLVVPKKEVDYIFDLDEATLAEMNVFAKKVAVAIRKAIPCKRIGVAVIGLEVPHTHVHLVPMNETDDLNFTRPKLHPSKEALANAAEKIRQSFN
jgi:histidine triad (HIT) family protein